MIGSIPTAYLVAKILRNIDIRAHGSGNVGATNVMRVIGVIPGVFVLVVDFIKGALSVFTPKILGYENMISLCFVFVVIGHVFPIFLRFRGGKGVATAAGILFSINPGLFAICLLVFLCVFIVSKYISLSSIVSSSIAILLFWFLNEDVLINLGLTAIYGLILYRHKSNIIRLIKGIELKIK